MNAEPLNHLEPEIQAALDEIQMLVLSCYPEARFSVAHGEDPEGTYLRAMVDIEDLDSVVDCYIDRLVDMQVEENLPVYVVTLHPPERVVVR